MANMDLLVAHRGTNHVLPELWAKANQAQHGSGNYTFNYDNNFDYEIVDNTHVKIKKGIAMIQGRPAILSADVVVVIENGSTNYVRKDLICLRVDRTGGLENVNVVVIKGTEVLSGAVDPIYNTGNFNVDADLVDYPLHRVNLNGLVIGTIDALRVVRASAIDELVTLNGLVNLKQDSLYRGVVSSGDFNDIIAHGTYAITNTNMSNRPVSATGRLTVYSHDKTSSVVYQTFATTSGSPSFFSRMVGQTAWTEHITTANKKQDSVLKPGDGTSSFQLFTLTELRTMFGVGAEKTAANFTAIVTNGDAQANGNHFDGTTWDAGTILRVTMNGNLIVGIQTRVNYVIFMN